MVVGTKSDKELSRARKAMGAAWVNDVNYAFSTMSQCLFMMTFYSF